MRHPGNQRLKVLVAEVAADYSKLAIGARREVVRGIISVIEGGGGEFLEVDPRGGLLPLDSDKKKITFVQGRLRKLKHNMKAKPAMKRLQWLLAEAKSNDAAAAEGTNSMPAAGTLPSSSLEILAPEYCNINTTKMGEVQAGSTLVSLTEDEVMDDSTLASSQDDVMEAPSTESFLGSKCRHGEDFAQLPPVQQE